MVVAMVVVVGLVVVVGCSFKASTFRNMSMMPLAFASAPSPSPWSPMRSWSPRTSPWNPLSPLQSTSTPWSDRVSWSRPFSRPRRRSQLSASESESATGTKTGIKYGKWFTFWACFFGYSVCYFTRQSLSYTAPVLRQAMGWKGLSEIGKLQSLFPLAYGSSRFLGGLLGDLMSPKRVFALGLCICSLLNIAFGLSSTLPQFAVFWLLNGCFQGVEMLCFVQF